MSDAERALLGAVLSGYRAVPDLMRMVDERDFTQPHDGEIWTAVCRVYATGSTPDPLTVRAALGQVKLPGGPVYLAELMQACPNVGSAGAYAKVVADDATRRRLRSVASVIHDLTDAERDIPEAAEDIRQRIDEAVRRTSRNGPVRLVGVLPEVLEIAEKGAPRGISTPWPDLDRLVRGLAPGRLIVIGGRPGGGKSISGTNLAAHVAGTHRHSVYIASMEMDRVEIDQRFLSAEAQVDITALENGTMSERGWDAVRDATHRMNDWAPRHVQDEPNLTVGQIRAEVRDIRRTETVALVVVDYLQLLTPRDRRTVREQQIAEITRGLKLLAREQDVCVVALSQINRAATQRRDGRPMMADLRESGAIENDADVVVLFHRPDDESPELEVIVAKQRNGPIGECRLQLQGHLSRLVSQSHYSRGVA